MTLTTVHNRLSYISDGSTGAFPYTFLVLSAAELWVYVDDIRQPSTAYLVSNLGVGSGGTVTLAATPDSGARVDLIRATDQTQQVNLQEGDKLPSEAVEGMFDKAYAAIQDIGEQVTRAVKVPPTSPGGTPTEPTMPALSTLAGQVLKVNVAGTALEGATLTGVDFVSPITSQGDLIRGATDGSPERLPVGTAGQVLTVVTGQAAWQPPSASGIPPTIFVAKGDLIVASAAATATRKPSGSSGAALTTDASSADGLLWVLGGALHGRVRLGTTTANSITLAPYNGNTLYVKRGSGWRVQSLSAFGISAINTNAIVDGTGGSTLTANTTYLVTVIDEGSNLALDFRTSLAHEHDLDFGVEIATGMPGNTVVGMVRTNASTQFTDVNAQRFVLNWFNRRPLTARNAFTSNRTTTSQTFVELHTEIRAEFLSWAEDSVVITTSGSRALTSGTATTGLGITNTSSPAVVSASDAGLSTVALTWSGPISDGYHWATLLAATNVAFSVSTYHGADVAGLTGQCRIFVTFYG